MTYKNTQRDHLVFLSNGDSNWDFYLNESNRVLAIAKPESGASDCGFGSLEYYKRYMKIKLIKEQENEC